MGTGDPPKPQWACGGPQTWHLSYHREPRSREYHHPTAATLPTTTRAWGVDSTTKHSGETTKLTTAAVADTLIGVLLSHILSTLCSSLRGKYPQNGL